jgi:hypothetical protein
MKRVEITIGACVRCPYNRETHIRATNGLGMLSECAYCPSEPRLIQRPDEDFGPFPEWCPLPNAMEDKC